MTDKEYKMIEELQAAESGLSSWEMDFLDTFDLEDPDTRQRKLSDLQIDKVEEIWQKIFGPGGTRGRRPIRHY